MSAAIVGDDELSSVLQDDGNIEAMNGSNSSSHPSTSSSDNIAIGVLIGVVDDDDGNDDVIVTNLQQETGVDSCIMIGLEKKEKWYVLRAVSMLLIRYYWARMGTEQDSEYV